MAYLTKKIIIKAEATASDEAIIAAGGKKTLKISNHLIQDSTVAKSVADSYLSDYEVQKIKIIINSPTPLPYEIRDTLLHTDAELLYCIAASAKIPYAPAAEGKHYYVYFRKLIIRKINLRFSAGNYISIIELED